MADAERVSRASCIRQLAHLANEYRAARQLPFERSFAELKRLDNLASDVVASAWNSGYLLEVESILRRRCPGISEESLSHYGPWLFRTIAGYDGFKPEARAVPGYTVDDLGLVRKLEIEINHYQLLPGLLDPEAGFGEFQAIDLGSNVRDVESRFEAMAINTFEIMGYRHKLCEILVEMLESEEAGADDQDASTHAMRDGLYPDERCLIWGGDKYDRLTPKMIKILEVLVDRYNRGFPVVTVQEISKRSKYPFDGGFIGQGFKLNRKGDEKLHPVHRLIEKISEGEYQLRPPA